MGQRKKKILRHTFRAVVIVAVGLFLLNLFLTNRLERYLRKELVRRTTEATDGFYRLSFDDLSVSFFKGELMIEGIRLTPDSLIFQQWKAIDSLPQMYVDARIREMGFTGLNLTWRWNFKQLDFFSFEIKQPDVRIHDTFYSDRFQKKTKNVSSKSLYELISPYIDALSVREIDLDDARVSYTVDHPVTPIVYALKDVSFHGYGFLVDSTSSADGKLFYLDNFEFETYQPQCLLTNNDFTLETDSIRLSTEDSLVYIGNLRIIPQEKLWQESKHRPDRWLATSVRTVQAHGVGFKRKESLNYLTARSFYITDTRIDAFNMLLPSLPDPEDISIETQQTPKASNPSGKADKARVSPAARRIPAYQAGPVDRLSGDSLVRALSLYEIISPLLHSIAIERVGIGNARLDYSQRSDTDKESYRLDYFDFQGDGFLIDSLSVEKYDLGYFRNIAFEANGITADMTAQNHCLTIERMALNTEKGSLQVDKANIKPCTTKTSRDYLSGSIDTVRIDSLHYDKGVSAGLLKISSPRLQYVKAPSAKPKGKKGASSNHRADVDGLLNPFFRYLTLGRIEIQNGFLTFTDREKNETTVYKLNDFDFFATAFRMDEATGRGDGLFFSCRDMGFRFADFNNYLPGKDYRLSIRRGRLSTLDGTFRLQDVKFLPQERIRRRDSVSYIGWSTPLVDIRGLRFPHHRLEPSFKMAALRIETPAFSIGKEDSTLFHTTLDKIDLKDISYDSLLFSIGTADVVRPIVNLHSFAFGPDGKKDSMHTASATDSLPAVKPVRKQPSPDIYQVLGNVAKRWQVKELNLRQGEMGYSWQFENTFLTEKGKSTIDLSVKDISVDAGQRKWGVGTIRFEGNDLEFPMDNGFYALKVGRIDLDGPRLQIDSIHMVSPYPKMEFAYFHPHHKDWFDVSADHLTLTGLDVPSFLSDHTLKADELRIRGILLQNYKNKKIPITPHIVPMIYTVIQKAPLRFSIANAYINDFFVIYEEISPKGTRPGKLVFTDMNGHITGLTNIPTYREQYIRLDATGKMMDNGSFKASWWLPVDSLNDRFLLTAEMERLDLTTLNQIITPLASAVVKSGHTEKLHFHMDAGSEGGTIEMALPYRDLKVALLKKKDGEVTDKAFLSRIANWVLKHDNPSYPERADSKLREVSMYVTRDPYHSSFNYLWQLLKPALIETVGITRTEQKIAAGVVGFFAKVKKFFGFGKKKQITPPPPESFILIEEVENEIWVEEEQTDDYPLKF